MSKKILWVTTGDMNLEPIVGSLQSIEELDLTIEHYCFNVAQGSTFFDGDLATKVAASPPDAVLYIGPLAGPFLPRPFIFQTIREICPIAHIVLDGACPESWPTLKKFRENKCFDVTVNIDGNQNWPKGENDLTLLCPIDPRYYYKKVKKDVPFGFYGSSSSKDREKILEHVKDKVTLSLRNERFGSYQGYADFMLRCRSVLNMAKTGSGQTMHVKARVIEAGLSRACLLEEKGSPTRNWFKPGDDYLEYSDRNELSKLLERLDKDALYYQALAESLYRKVGIYHSPDTFFKKVFEKMGVQIPLK